MNTSNNLLRSTFCNDGCIATKSPRERLHGCRDPNQGHGYGDEEQIWPPRHRHGRHGQKAQENYGGVRIQRRRPTEDHKWTWLKPNSDAHGDKRKQAAHPSPRRGRFIAKKGGSAYPVPQTRCPFQFFVILSVISFLPQKQAFSYFFHLGFLLPRTNKQCHFIFSFAFFICEWYSIFKIYKNYQAKSKC